MSPRVVHCELCGDNEAYDALPTAVVVVDRGCHATAAARESLGRRFCAGAWLCQTCGEQTEDEATLTARFTEHAAERVNAEGLAQHLDALSLSLVARPARGGGVWVELVGPAAARDEVRVIHLWSEGAYVEAAAAQLVERLRVGVEGCACANCARPGAMTALRPFTLPEGWGRGERRVFRGGVSVCSICAEGLRDLADWAEAA